MIVGVEHLGLSDSSGQALACLNYRKRFSEHVLPNDPSKRPYLHEYQGSHDIDYYDPPDQSPAIELIVHGSLSRRDHDPYPTVVINLPVENARPPGAPLASALRDGLGYRGPFGVGTIPGTTLDVVSALDATSRVAAYVVPVASVPTAMTFWGKGLGFSVTSRDPEDQWACLRLAPPVPRWRMIVILCSGYGRPLPRYIDEEAFNNIAFLSSDVARDRDRLLGSRGVELGEVFSIRVHERDLRVCVGRSPDGDVIELIQVAGRTVPTI